MMMYLELSYLSLLCPFVAGVSLPVENVPRPVTLQSLNVGPCTPGSSNYDPRHLQNMESINLIYLTFCISTHALDPALHTTICKNAITIKAPALQLVHFRDLSATTKNYYYYSRELAPSICCRSMSESFQRLAVNRYIRNVVNHSRAQETMPFAGCNATNKFRTGARHIRPSTAERR